MSHLGSKEGTVSTILLCRPLRAALPTPLLPGPLLARRLRSLDQYANPSSPPIPSKPDGIALPTEGYHHCCLLSRRPEPTYPRPTTYPMCTHQSSLSI